MQPVGARIPRGEGPGIWEVKPSLGAPHFVQPVATLPQMGAGAGHLGCVLARDVHPLTQLSLPDGTWALNTTGSNQQLSRWSP